MEAAGGKPREKKTERAKKVAGEKTAERGKKG
jgi:hypothetical protein